MPPPCAAARPGRAAILDHMLSVATFVVALVCFLPEILISQFAIPFYFGGTSVLIVVSVTMDTINQVQSHLLAHQYEGLMKKANLKSGSRGSFARG